MRGSRLQNRRFGEAVELVKNHAIDLSGEVSHTFSYLDAQAAFDFADNHANEVRKIVLTFDTEESK